MQDSKDCKVMFNNLFRDYQTIVARKEMEQLTKHENMQRQKLRHHHTIQQRQEKEKVAHKDIQNEQALVMKIQQLERELKQAKEQPIVKEVLHHKTDKNNELMNIRYSNFVKPLEKKSKLT